MTGETGRAWFRLTTVLLAVCPAVLVGGTSGKVTAPEASSSLAAAMDRSFYTVEPAARVICRVRLPERLRIGSSLRVNASFLAVCASSS